MRLTTQNRVEKIDPWHRGGAEFEIKERDGHHVVNPTSNPLSVAFCDWLSQDTEIPFFIWLETDRICTATPGLDDEWSAELRRVKKTDYFDDVQRSLHEVTIVAGQLRASGLDEPVTMDTSDRKMVKGEIHPTGGYAFVWAAVGKTYAAPHKAGRLHHSSFASGKKVKAAGMLGVKEGKVVWIDNNTGHYRTDGAHLYAFVEHLKSSRVLNDKDGVVVAHGFSDKPIKFDRFLKHNTPGNLRAKIHAGRVVSFKKGDKDDTPGKDVSKKVFADLAAFRPPTIGTGKLGTGQ